MALMTIRFELTGINPLILHADNVDAADAMKAWRTDADNKKSSVAGDDRSPYWTWRTYLYSDGEHISVPSDNLMVAIRQAGAKMTLKGNKTFKEISQSGIQPIHEFCELRTSGGERVSIAPFDWRDAFENPKILPFAEERATVEKYDFELFVKRARVGQAKHVRVRPLFRRGWKLSGEVQVTAKEITEKVAAELFSLAGEVGIGDWRPGCKTPGIYGMFTSKLKFS